MNAPIVRLTLIEEGVRQPAVYLTFRADEQVGVRELCTLAVLSVRAADISLYRHTVLMSGRAFRVLNVLH